LLFTKPVFAATQGEIPGDDSDEEPIG